MRTFNPYDLPLQQRHQYIIGAVGPRPIAWASTIDNAGNPNLAPYSFFNAFSSNPPILVFSSNRRGRNNTTKDTLHNITANKEVVINVVSQKLLHQMTISSSEYSEDVNEFEKAGLNMLESELVKPFRVAESPIQLECTVNDIIKLGTEGGAGNLFICEIVKMHFADYIFNDKDEIDPNKLKLMGRMGKNYYTKSFGDSLITINNPITPLNLGFDQLPDYIKHSEVLTGNDIAKLAMLTDFPNNALVESVKEKPEVQVLASDLLALHLLAQEWLDQGLVEDAFALLLGE